ncbi:Membrane-fusion protein [Labilithrix luteola]|uniref:Membrane-fusion protein n=1 Tax=Labilithrix luteola TaxID=1391654 RepID=A0A0K1Q3Q2_9BACT|nr:Membrane-fusion protein [Labilithrix luteola]
MVVCFFGLLAGGAGCSGTASKEQAPAAKRKAPETIALEAHRIPKTLSYSGTIAALRDVTLSSARGGQVETYNVEIGKPVQAGDVLVKLGASELSYASQAAAYSATQAAERTAGIKDAANLPSAIAAKAALDVASDAARRAERLHAQGSMSEQELLRIKTNEASVKAQYDAALNDARAELGRVQELRAVAGQAQAALTEKVVRAPFAGIVQERFIEIGQTAAPNAALLRLVDPSQLRVRFEVPQFDADKVVLGRGVNVIAGGVARRAQVVRSTPGLGGDANTRLVEATLAEADAALLPGARVQALLETGDDEEVVDVPVSATTQTAGLTRAWIVDGNHLTERLLTIARYDGARVLVRSGLKGGERLVKMPQPDFRIGEEVVP